MAVTYDNTVKNAQLDGISTAWGASATLRLYSGTPPANQGTALSGNTLLAQCTPTPAAASGGTKDMLGGAKSGTASATGTASFYRIYKSDGTTCVEQGTVTATGGGGDLTIDNTSIASGQTVNFNTFTKSIA